MNGIEIRSVAYLRDFVSTCEYEDDPILTACSWAADEIERLRAIVDKLPKTADGVPVLPGMRLFRVLVDEIEEVSVMGIWEKRDISSRPLPVYAGEWSCYSTREAAEAAWKKLPDWKRWAIKSRSAPD